MGVDQIRMMLYIIYRYEHKPHFCFLNVEHSSLFFPALHTCVSFPVGPAGAAFKAFALDLYFFHSFFPH